MLHGDDFWYQHAEMVFRNTDFIIETCNQIQKSNVRMKYSTPMEYYRAIEEENIDWPTFDRDWFPYSMRPHNAWSGYYTSRA